MVEDEHFIVTVKGSSRECRIEGDEFVHVLNSAWRIGRRDKEIENIKPCGRVEKFYKPEDR